jgi:hypothetical protein
MKVPPGKRAQLQALAQALIDAAAHGHANYLDRVAVIAREINLGSKSIEGHAPHYRVSCTIKRAKRTRY